MRKSPIKRLAIVLVTICAWFSHSDAAVQEQNPTAPRSNAQPLAPNTALTDELETGITRVYSLQLDAQQVVRIVVAQKGVDAVVKVYQPNGSLYREVDNPNGLYGPEIVTLLAHTTSVFKIEVRADVAVPGGGYELIVEGTRTISANDEKRVEAESIFAQAQQLRRERKYQPAIQKYDEALTLWRQLEEKREEGYSLTNEG